jgi:nucleoside-diphosphate-sugar epimerase
MKVLLTGAGGYIGSVLAEKLVSAGYNLICLDRFFFGKDILSTVADRAKSIKDDIRTFDRSIIYGTDEVLDLVSFSNDPSGELDLNKTLEMNYKG